MSSDLHRAGMRVGVLLAAASLLAAGCQATPSPGPAPEAPVERRAPPPSPGESETLDFEPGDARLSESHLATLRKLAARMQPYPELRVHIVGYSDPGGAESDGAWLSERRAKNVASYLTSQGLAVHNVTLQGAGASAASETSPGNASHVVITLQ